MTLGFLLALAVVQFLQWTVVLPADVQAWLAFHRDDAVLGQWWTLGTHALVHSDLSVLALNAYVLALFGVRLERTWGAPRQRRLLVLGTLLGWTTALVGGTTAPWMGASSAAFAVLAAYALRWSDEPHLLFGRVPVSGRWVAALMASALLLTGLDGTGAGFLAHLGGGLAAWFLMPTTFTRPRRSPREATEAPATTPPAVTPEPRASSTRSTSTEPPRTATAPVQVVLPTIDAILDKISAEGIDQLTDEERRVLDDHSRRLRGD